MPTQPLVLEASSRAGAGAAPSAGVPMFRCSFCYGMAGGVPRVLGRSARLACASCHAALVDLSICWLCGEVIFRGEDCVSLGWCFWHRACYGCLLCGSRSVCAGVRLEDLFRDEEEAAPTTSGREVTKPPLCAGCMVEAQATETDDSRPRGPLGHAGVADESMLPKTTRRFTRCDMFRGEKGDEAGQGSNLHTIWVDIHDPLNKPPFRPSRWKPVPMFMQLRAIGKQGSLQRGWRQGTEKQADAEMGDEIAMKEEEDGGGLEEGRRRRWWACCRRACCRRWAGSGWHSEPC